MADNPYEDDDDEGSSAGDMPLPGGDFRMFVSKLGFQALIALGLVENPLTKKSEINLGHAKMVIEDLRMLRDKTKGNIDRDEEAHLSKILSDLQFQFVEKSKGA
jgi:hypothetical protein